MAPAKTPFLVAGKIQLVKLHPGRADEDIQVQYYIANLEKNEGYKALSYVWGEAPCDRKLTITFLNSAGDKIPIPVTRNLQAALRRLRQSKSTTWLWVDALCIDQNNMAEKEAQIGQMAKIYGYAEEVCIYLGEEDADSKIAMPFVKVVADLENIEGLMAAEHAEKWRALSRLILRPWFSRRWVVQEIGMARQARVYCGSAAAVKWTTFADAISIFCSKSYDMKQLFYKEPRLLGEVRASGASTLVNSVDEFVRRTDDGKHFKLGADIEALVARLTHFKVTVPWDTVYAVRALAKNGQETFCVNYSKPLVEVCKEVVVNAIENTGSLDILCRPWGPNRDEIERWAAHNPAMAKYAALRFPTWIRYSNTAPFAPTSGRAGDMFMRVHADLLIGTPRHPIYNASGSSTATNVEFSTAYSNRTIIVDGFQIDTVGLEGERCNGGVIPGDWLTLAGWNRRDTPHQPVPRRLLRTLVGDRGLDGGRFPVWYRQACEWCWNHKSVLSELNIEMGLVDKLPSPAAEFLERVKAVVWKRVLFTTKAGLLGLGPGGTRRGALVVVLKGCSVPVILDKHVSGEGKTYYRLVGECYVHDMMDGNAMTGLKEGKYTLERFSIS